ncbi:MAG: Bud site selection protein 6 [Thelocarpon superellum]|nr:MAG: Bud site selection protein 6 [Thelocarpon superellum]
MQTPPGSQRSMQRRVGNDPSSSSSSNPAQAPTAAATSSTAASAGPATRTSSAASSKSQSYRRANPSQQLSQIEKSVTHLLVATKQLLETLTQWSRHNATEAEVSDVYVRLGYEFNIASRAFNAIGVDTADLGNVPDLLRSILEDTLSQDASPASLDRYLPRIRDIIINLLHGLKRKQQKLRQRQAKDDAPPAPGPVGRQDSVSSTTSGETGLNQMLDDPSMRFAGNGNGNGNSSTQPMGRSASREHTGLDDSAVPPRISSVHGGRASPRQDGALPAHRSRSTHTSRAAQQATATLSSAVANLPSSSAPPAVPALPADPPSIHVEQSAPPATSTTNNNNALPAPPPPTPPKQQEALAALQRGGDLERRASRRYSAYQISKHLGASANGVPMLPPAQYSPIPNRGRDVRESMNAVRTRGSLLQGQSTASLRSGAETSPNRSQDATRPPSEHDGLGGSLSSYRPAEASRVENGIARPQEEKAGSVAGEAEAGGVPTSSTGVARLVNPDIVVRTTGADGDRDAISTDVAAPAVARRSVGLTEKYLTSSTSTPDVRQFIPEQSPQPGKELTLFLQYKSKIKKVVLPDGYNDLSVARLQLAFIEKFAWNTHSNGIDLPEIYIQDPVSGVRHELEDLSDVKDRSVLVLNVEALDEVKKHIDEGLGGLKRMVEGVRGAVDGQHTHLQRVAERQQDTAKEMARLAAAPAPAPSSSRTSRIDGAMANGPRGPASVMDHAGRVSEVQSLRRDLAVMRQTYSNFVSDMETSMTEIRAKASSVKTVAIKAAIPTLDGESGRAYVNKGKKDVGEVSDGLVNKVDDLQDIVEDLRKDVVLRGVRPLPRQLEDVSKDISAATTELKKMQEFLRREKPKWSKIWENELQVVCDDRDLLTMQEALAADLQDDLDNAAQTFALVEEATKEQMKDGQLTTSRSTSRGLTALVVNAAGDPHMAKEGVLGEVRALQPNHENRLEAIERAERARLKELESRRGGEFQKELGSFVEEGRLKKSGGVEEAERVRKAKDERVRREVWERQQARAKAKEAKEAEKAAIPPSASDSGAIPSGAGTGDGATTPAAATTPPRDLAPPGGGPGEGADAGEAPPPAPVSPASTVLRSFENVGIALEACTSDRAYSNTADQEIELRSMDDAVDAPLIPPTADAGVADHDARHGVTESGFERPSLFVWTLTVAAGISGLLFGYDTGVISATLISIGPDLSQRELTTWDKSLITSCTSFAALVASPLTGLLADRLGRKRVILLADVLFLLGAIWQASSAHVWGMVGGRSVVGLAIGGASLIVPLYIAELSPSPFRGRLVTLSILFVTMGQMVSYVIGYAFSSHPHGWRWMVGLGAVPAALQFVILIFLPESPRWLVSVGHLDEARAVLDRVYGTHEGSGQMVDAVMSDIARETREEQEATKQRSSRRGFHTGRSRVLDWVPEGWYELVMVGGNRRALTIACLLQGLQQLCGFNSLMYFSATIFALVGFPSPTLTSLTVAFTNFVFTLAALLVIDGIGRRRILLSSIPVMVLGLALCSFAFDFLDLSGRALRKAGNASHGRSSELWPSLILVATMVYVSGYALGIGNVAWQQSELFPLSVRSKGCGIATGTNWASNFLVGLTFLPMMEGLTPTWTFASYAVVCLLGWLAVWLIYPETKGLRLEEVGGLLAEGFGVRESLVRVRSERPGA